MKNNMKKLHQTNKQNHAIKMVAKNVNKAQNKESHTNSQCFWGIRETAPPDNRFGLVRIRLEY